MRKKGKSMFNKKITIKRIFFKASVLLAVLAVSVAISPKTFATTISGCADLNADGKVNILDASATGLAFNTCGSDANYDYKADINGDNCVNQADMDIITANFNQTTSCAQAAICPDINTDGRVSILDSSIIGLSWFLCSGQTGYNSMADITGDNCVDNGDMIVVEKYFNKSASEIDVCAASDSIKIISPNGGEKWMRGGSYDITWSTAGASINASASLSKINIGASAGGKDLGMIAMGVDASSGKYAWTIPVEFGLGFNDSNVISAKIRIEDSADSSIYDDSDDYFSIVGEIDNAASDTESTITASPEVVFADGLSKSKITVTVKNKDGVLLDNKTVTIFSDRSHIGDAYENSTYTVVTNSNGVAEISVTSNLSGISTYTAIVDWNMRLGIGYKGTTLIQKAKVNFVSAENNCLFPDGTLVKLPNDPKVYVIRDCKKYWIRSVEEFTTSGYKWLDVNEYSPATVDSIPEISAITLTPNISEGAIIQVDGDPDVYIVKYAGGKSFKRLILNPSVFNSYGHLKWENIIKVDKTVLDSFTTSNLVRSAASGKIYSLNPNGDTGARRLIRDAAILRRLGFDSSSAYEINETDENLYVEGDELK